MQNVGNSRSRDKSRATPSPHCHGEAVPPDVLAARLETFGSDLTGRITSAVRTLIEQHATLKPLLSVKDVAQTLGVSVRTVETIVADGELRPLWIEGQRRFHPDTVAAFIRSADRSTPKQRKRRSARREGAK